MSLAHELRVLEIESQTELLDRLKLLTQFGSNLTNVTGAKGAGKSWIAQRYLESRAQDKNQSLLMCHPNRTDAQRRTIILNQLVSDALFNENDPLPDSFSRMMDEESCDVVIVVDDAQLLGDLLLSELWSLVLLAQERPAWNINVILFTTGNKLDAILSRLSYGQENKSLALEIEPFSSQEVDIFMESLVLKYVSGAEQKQKIRNKINTTPPLPGALIALGESKTEKRIIIRSIIGSPLKIVALVIILLLLIGGGYFWFFNQSGPELEEPLVDQQKAVEQTVISPQTVLSVSAADSAITDNSAVTDNNAVTNNNSADSHDSSGAGNNVADEDDFASLPPVVTDKVATVGSADDGQRVVVPSTVVDALVEGDDSVDTQVIDDAVTKIQQQATASAAETEPERGENITFSFAKQELLAVSDRHYTIQLAALRSMASTQNFITEYDLESEVRIYSAYRSGTQWFIVTYQDFATIQAARSAKAELPEKIRKLGPWVKSMLQVHREINSSN